MPGYPCLAPIFDILSCFLQRFLRQQVEDGDDPYANWGADLPAPAAEDEDPDDEDNLPILDGKQLAKTRASSSGKKPVQVSSSIRDWSEDDDDGCRILIEAKVSDLSMRG